MFCAMDLLLSRRIGETRRGVDRGRFLLCLLSLCYGSSGSIAAKGGPGWLAKP